MGRGGASRSRRSKSRHRSKSRPKTRPINVTAPECQTPRCISCRYFALKEYFILMGHSEKNARTKIEDYSQGLYNDKVTIFDPRSAEAMPDGLSVVFITGKRDTIDNPKHAFLLEKIGNQYYIHSSWGTLRAATKKEWNTYRKQKTDVGEEYVDHDEYEVREIGHLPTTQGPFEETTLREYLTTIKPNLHTLFGLTPQEIVCIDDSFQNISIQIFKIE